MKLDDIIKLRTKKFYADAANHILVGSVTSFNKVFVELACRAYHYKGVLLGDERLVESTIETRIIPWSNVECVNVLPPTFPWRDAKVVKGDDGLYLESGEERVLLCRTKMTH